LRMLRTFKPDLIHVQVLTRAGVVALAYKMLHHVPYVISEHWSRYFPENDNFKGFLRKMLTRKVIRGSGGVIAVSGILKTAMEQHGLSHENFYVIPNVVDETIFSLSNNPAQPLTRRIVHVSCFEEKSKNISGLLRAVKTVAETRKDFQCYLVGEGPDLESSQRLAASLGLKDIVIFTGLKEGKELVSFINTADFLVLSSRYETFGTVIAEALACGVPVVSTAVGIAPEVIHDKNGIIVPAGNDALLSAAILKMLKDCRQYDREEIRQEILGKFNSESVARMLMTAYAKALDKE
ncbi:MAG: glycosyltransferase, partial [Syntrophothermus sp.]